MTDGVELPLPCCRTVSLANDTTWRRLLYVFVRTWKLVKCDGTRHVVKIYFYIYSVDLEWYFLLASIFRSCKFEGSSKESERVSDNEKREWQKKEIIIWMQLHVKVFREQDIGRIIIIAYKHFKYIVSVPWPCYDCDAHCLLHTIYEGKTYSFWHGSFLTLSPSLCPLLSSRYIYISFIQFDSIALQNIIG